MYKIFMLVASCLLLVAGYWLLGAGSSLTDARYWLESETKKPETGSWVLVGGCWFPVAGCLLLGLGSTFPNIY
jgi:hypothetical protein